MKPFLYSLTVLAMLSGCTSNTKKLEESVRAELAKQDGVFAVAFKDLTTGEELLISQHERFHAASTMKTPVMIEVFKQAGAGRFSMGDSVVLKNEFKSIVDSSLYALDPVEDSEKDLYQQIGWKKTIGDLTYAMIIASSNLSTNTIIELVDARNVTASMRTLGAKDIEVLRGVEDQKAFEKGLINSTTAYDLMLIFEQLANGTIIDKESSDAMIKILLDQKFSEIIPAKLPNTVKVAHKDGSITGVRHDSGIVFLPDGRKYVLVLLSKEMKDEEAGIKAMANVSEMIYHHVTGH